MNKLRSRLPLLCLILILPSAVLAQEQPKEPDEQTKAAEMQAYEMLDSIAESIPSLRSSDNRIYLTAAVADLLWTRNEKRARSLFQTLTKEVNLVMSNLDPADQNSINTLNMMQQQRREIIERICRRDPELALAFLRATRPPQELQSRSGDHASENNLELFLVAQLAQKEPELALTLARTNLKNGVTYALVSVLQNIASKSPESARALHAEMVERLKTQDLTTSYEPSNAAWGLMTGFTPPQASEEAYRSLVEFLANCVLSVKPDLRGGNFLVQNFSGQVPGQMSIFEKYVPARVGALRQWAQQVSRTMDPGSKMYQELNTLSQNGLVEDILALANKFPEQRFQIYQQAAQKAMNSGDVTRARQIITEFVTDTMQQRQMLEQLDNQWFWTTVNQNRIAEARLLLQRITNPEQRFQLLIAMASNLINRNEKEQASAVLVEATDVLNSLPANSNKVNAQLQLAQTYSSIDARQAVTLLQSVIGVMNQLVTAAATLDGFENSYLREGEWIKRSYSNIGNLVNNVEQSLAKLARVDAEGARILSNQLERPEIRLTAQLEIAESLLSGGPNVSFGGIRHVYLRRGH